MYVDKTLKRNKYQNFSTQYQYPVIGIFILNILFWQNWLLFYNRSQFCQNKSSLPFTVKAIGFALCAFKSKDQSYLMRA